MYVCYILINDIHKYTHTYILGFYPAFCSNFINLSFFIVFWTNINNIIGAFEICWAKHISVGGDYVE